MLISLIPASAASYPSVVILYSRVAWSRPLTAAALAIPDLAALIFSAYCNGIRVDFHSPACVIAARLFSVWPVFVLPCPRPTTAAQRRARHIPDCPEVAVRPLAYARAFASAS